MLSVDDDSKQFDELLYDYPPGNNWFSPNQSINPIIFNLSPAIQIALGFADQQFPDNQYVGKKKIALNLEQQGQL